MLASKIQNGKLADDLRTIDAFPAKGPVEDAVGRRGGRPLAIAQQIDILLGVFKRPLVVRRQKDSVFIRNFVFVSEYADKHSLPTSFNSDNGYFVHVDSPFLMSKLLSCAGGRGGGSPNFSSCHHYTRGLKTTVGILPPLTRFCVNSTLTVGYVRAIALTSPTAGVRSPLMGLKSGVLAGRRAPHRATAGMPSCRRWRRLWLMANGLRFCSLELPESPELPQNHKP